MCGTSDCVLRRGECGARFLRFMRCRRRGMRRGSRFHPRRRCVCVRRRRMRLPGLHDFRICSAPTVRCRAFRHWRRRWSPRLRFCDLPALRHCGTLPGMHCARWSICTTHRWSLSRSIGSCSAWNRTGFCAILPPTPPPDRAECRPRHCVGRQGNGRARFRCRHRKRRWLSGRCRRSLTGI